MRSFRKKQEAEKPIPDDVRLAIRRALSTPDGKELLAYLRARGGVDDPTYLEGRTHEAMIHHGARKALVNDLISILEA